MNGAAAVPDRKTSTPNSKITTTIGSSHHFLLWLRNCQNSDAMLPPPRCDASSKRFIEPPKISELAEIGVDALRRLTARPVASRLLAPQAERVTTHEPEDDRERREHEIEQRRDDDPRNGPSDRERRNHPRGVHVADRGRPREAEHADR